MSSPNRDWNPSQRDPFLGREHIHEAAASTLEAADVAEAIRDEKRAIFFAEDPLTYQLRRAETSFITDDEVKSPFFTDVGTPNEQPRAKPVDGYYATRSDILAAKHSTGLGKSLKHPFCAHCIHRIRWVAAKNAWAHIAPLNARTCTDPYPRKPK